MKDPHAIIKGLQITEKGTRLTTEGNKYLLKVSPAANKMEIKRAVQEFFKVTVLKVNTMNCTGKSRGLRMNQNGKQPDWKRAIVTLRQGDKIDLE